MTLRHRVCGLQRVRSSLLCRAPAGFSVFVHGNTVRLRVAIDKDELPDRRNGAKVTAKIYCGQRSLGYVWLHELFETVQAKVLFWF